MNAQRYAMGKHRNLTYNMELGQTRVALVGSIPSKRHYPRSTRMRYDACDWGWVPSCGVRASSASVGDNVLRACRYIQAETIAAARFHELITCPSAS